jgi:hypothetical protein
VSGSLIFFDKLRTMLRLARNAGAAAHLRQE